MYTIRRAWERLWGYQFIRSAISAGVIFVPCYALLMYLVNVRNVDKKTAIWICSLPGYLLNFWIQKEVTFRDKDLSGVGRQLLTYTLIMIGLILMSPYVNQFITTHTRLRFEFATVVASAVMAVVKLTVLPLVFTPTVKKENPKLPQKT